MSDILKQYHPAKAVTAILFMLLFIASIGLLAWAANKGVTATGPVHIAADKTQVFVTLNDEILWLDASGALRERFALESLGIDAYPIDLRLRDDGALLVATQRPAGLYVCRSPQWQCRAVENPMFEQLRSQIKVLSDSDGKGLFISDTAGGRVHWLSADGRNTRVLTRAPRFDQANDIALDELQRLWIADSGNRRIVILQADTSGDWSMSGELSARSGTTRPELDWPMMIALSPGGDAWVVQSDATGQRADLLLYDAQLGIKARIDLAEDAYPTDVVRSGTGMLVTDMDAFHIVRVDIDTHAVTPFGDHRLQAILDAAAGEKADADRMMDFALAGMALFGVLMIAVAFWATPKGQRFTQQPKVPTLEPGPEPASRSGGLHWLVRDAKTEGFLRRVQRLLVVVTAGMAGLMLYSWNLLNRLLDDKAAACYCIADINTMLAVLGVLLLGGPVLAYLGFRHMRNRLGSDGHYLHVQLHDGQYLTLDPARLVYTGRALAYENHLLPIQTGNRKPLYAEGEVETHIAPLLSRATRLGVLSMLRYQFQHREAVTMASLFYIVAVTAVLWYTGAWRLILPQ